jgi:hypothetical protein
MGNLPLKTRIDEPVDYSKIFQVGKANLLREIHFVKRHEMIGLDFFASARTAANPFCSGSIDSIEKFEGEAETGSVHA